MNNRSNNLTKLMNSDSSLTDMMDNNMKQLKEKGLE